MTTFTVVVTVEGTSDDQTGFRITSDTLAQSGAERLLGVRVKECIDLLNGNITKHAGADGDEIRD